jgi:hypothetical protein
MLLCLAGSIRETANARFSVVSLAQRSTMLRGFQSPWSAACLACSRMPSSASWILLSSRQILTGVPPICSSKTAMAAIQRNASRCAILGFIQPYSAPIQIDAILLNPAISLTMSLPVVSGILTNGIEFFWSFAKEMLINSTNEMKHEAHGTQQPRHINQIGEDASAA